MPKKKLKLVYYVNKSVLNMWFSDCYQKVLIKILINRFEHFDHLRVGNVNVGM